MVARVTIRETHRGESALGAVIALVAQFLAAGLNERAAYERALGRPVKPSASAMFFKRNRKRINREVRRIIEPLEGQIRETIKAALTRTQRDLEDEKQPSSKTIEALAKLLVPLSQPDKETTTQVALVTAEQIVSPELLKARPHLREALEGSEHARRLPE